MSSGMIILTVIFSLMTLPLVESQAVGKTFFYQSHALHRRVQMHFCGVSIGFIAFCSVIIWLALTQVLYTAYIFTTFTLKCCQLLSSKHFII